MERFNQVINENSIEEDKGNRAKLPRCLVIDDSVLSKTGKTIENIGKVHNCQ